MTATSTLTAHRTSEATPNRTFTTATRTLALPARFDVHQVESFLAEISADAARLVVTNLDGSAVEMIDLAALRSLAGVAAEFPELKILQPSVALRATIGYCGQDRLADRLVLDDERTNHQLEAAA